MMASLYVSAGDASGQPVAYASEAAGLAVAVYPPAATSKLVLELDSKATVQLGGREWVRLAFAAPCEVQEGGWFEVDVLDLSTSWLLALPEVVVTDGSSSPSPGSGVKRVPITEADRAAHREVSQHRREHY